MTTNKIKEVFRDLLLTHFVHHEFTRECKGVKNNSAACFERTVCIISGSKTESVSSTAFCDLLVTHCVHHQLIRECTGTKNCAVTGF